MSRIGGKLILLVEDDVDLTQVVIEILEDEGFRVLSARNLADASVHFHQHKAVINTIVLDGQLATVDTSLGGTREEVTIEFAQMVVNDGAFRGRVVPFSGNPDIQSALAAISGSPGLPKPVDIDRLIRELSV